MKKESAFSDDYEICLLNEYLTCTVWLSVLSELFLLMRTTKQVHRESRLLSATWKTTEPSIRCN